MMRRVRGLCPSVKNVRRRCEAYGPWGEVWCIDSRWCAQTHAGSSEAWRCEALPSEATSVPSWALRAARSRGGMDRPRSPSPRFALRPLSTYLLLVATSQHPQVISCIVLCTDAELLTLSVLHQHDAWEKGLSQETGMGSILSRAMKNVKV